MSEGQGAARGEVLHGTRWDKWIFRSIGPIVALLVVAGVFSPGSGGTPIRILCAAIVLFALASTWRGWRLGTVELRPDGLHAYGAIRRWHWAWTELDHVEVGSGPLPFVARTANRPLVVYTGDGRATRLSSIVGKSTADGQPSWVALAADRINERIHAGHQRR